MLICSMLLFMYLVCLVSLWLYVRSRSFFAIFFFFFKQKTAYEMRISDWSSDVCSSDLHDLLSRLERRVAFEQRQPALGLAEEMRARDDLLARVAALLHAVGVQAFERELLRRPFLDLRLRKSRQAMGKVERRDGKSTRLNSSHYCASRMPSSACNKKQKTQ